MATNIQTQMTEQALSRCLTECGDWLCPVATCNQRLSRKQTLKSHLSGKHSIQAGEPRKRYRQYESDPLIPVPRSTKHMRLSQKPDEHGANTAQTEINEGNDETIYEAVLPFTPLPFIEEITEFMEEDTSVADMEICVDTSESEYSDSETENEYVDTKTAGRTSNDAPLYLISQADKVYSSTISHKEHIISLCAYAAKNNISNSAFKELLQLLKMHTPTNSLNETNPNRIKEECGFSEEFMMYHDYCDNCGALFPQDRTVIQCLTPACGNQRFTLPGNKHGKNSFVSGKIVKQLQEVVGRKDNMEILKQITDRPIQNDIYDIQDGIIYRNMEKNGVFLNQTNNISVTLFTDGVSLFKSTNTSYWPIYLVINELPPKQRFLRKNMLLWGLWQGIGKPRMNTFFFPFVQEMRKLYTEGIPVTYEGEKLTIRVMVSLITMDLQARAYMFNMTQTNGGFGCIYCEQEGESVPSGNGHCRSYAFINPKAAVRTADTINENVAEVTTSNQKFVKGIQGKSVLAFLPGFSIPSHVGIDYMHGVLLGVAKKLMTRWFDSKSYKEQYFIGHMKNEVDERLKSIKPPYLIHRTPRTIDGNLNHWKASEFRSWLLFYSVPCLTGILPAPYFEHYCCLVEGIFILLGDKITEEQLLRSEQLLDTFYDVAGDLYGQNFLGINVHNLGHLVECVRNLGPLWVYSCFAFESFNGEINKTIHGKGNICGEVFWALQREKVLEESVRTLLPGPAKEFVKDMLKKNVPASKSTIGYMCSVLEPTTELKLGTLSEPLKNLVMAIFETEDENKSLLRAQKIARNDFTFYSQSCTRVKNTKSNVALLEEMSDGCLFIEIMFFIFDPVSRRAVAVCTGMVDCGPFVEGRLHHLRLVENKTEEYIVPVVKLKEPVVYMTIIGKNIVAKFPNFVERD